MPTPDEHKALLFLATVAVLGVAMRACGSAGGRPDPTARVALATHLAAVDSAVTAGGSKPRRTVPRTAAAAPVPLVRPRMRDESRAAATSNERLDVDTAGASALDRLPGIGPSLAARIVADRESRGPFGGVEALARVKGIGPALVERLRPLVTFSGTPRPSDTEVPVERRRVRRP